MFPMRTCPMIKIIAALAFAALATAAQAQQQTIYGPDGRVIGRAAVDSSGTRTLYGPDGRIVTRESTSGNQTTVYGPDGRSIGKFTTTPQR